MFELSLHCREQEPVLLLLGNKADLATADGRQVAGAEAAEFARRHRMIFLETSALITQEVEYAFEVDMKNSGEIVTLSTAVEVMTGEMLARPPPRPPGHITLGEECREQLEGGARRRCC